jgi:hypothetical protein
MTSLHRYLSVIVLALVIAALATPIAQAGSARPDLAGKTEAKGYAALSQAILNTSRRGNASPSEAKGYAALSQAILNTSRRASTSPSEAKGYAALSQAILNTSRLQSQSQAVSSGFDWGDAGIGAAATLGLVLLTMAGLVTLARGRRRQPTHA